MKRTIIALFAIVAFAGTAIAAGPETITLAAKPGDVSFPHKKHQELVKGDCKACHEKAPGKIEGLNKEWAHKTCKGCHTEKKAGPTTCTGCHVKK